MVGFLEPRNQGGSIIIKCKKLIFAVLGAVFCVAFVMSEASIAKAAPASMTSASVGTSTDSQNWVLDADVSAVGAAAARSREVLNWALAIDGSGFTDSTSGGTGGILNSIKAIWGKIRTFTSIVFIALLIIIGFGIMLRTDWGIRSRRLLPYVLIALVVMNFSFIASATIVRLTDKLQQGFYSIPTTHLNASDLLTVKYNYQDFKGYRLAATYAEDAVRTQLWLVRLTTYTNYAIAIILILRIVILWGLTIFSPFLFPFLIFPATRRVAIIWVREFFRWLFIGPLLALFLSSVAYIWQQTKLNSVASSTVEYSGIPIVTNSSYLGTGATSSNKYYSATNIILAPPGLFYNDALGLSLISSTGTTGATTVNDSKNNLTDTETYVRFIVALIMLWSAIILPFLLLRMAIVMVTKNKTKISQRWDASAAKQYLSNIQQKITPPVPRGPKPVPAAGLARPIMVSGIARPQKITDTQREREVETRNYATNRISELKTTSIAQLAGLTQAIPRATELIQAKDQSLERIGQIEMDSTNIARTQEIFNKISQPSQIENVEDRRQFTNIGNSLSNLSTRGDVDARRVERAVNNNTAIYETANTREEIQKQIVKKYVTNISNISKTENQVRKDIQEKANQNDDKARLALQALDKVAQIAQIATKPIAQMTIKDRNNALSIANKVQHPEAIANEDEKKQFSALRDFIGQGVKKGDIDAATLEYSGKLMLWSKDAEDKNKLTNEVDKKLLERSTAGDKDFDKTKALWKKHYSEAAVPISDKIKSRRDWLEQEKQKLQAALDKLLSDDAKIRKAGLEEVKKVIPFMLMGDYSITDIAKYIMAKISAIDDTLKDLGTIEGKEKADKQEEVLVPVKKKEEAPQEKHAQLEQ